jgi:hypothetical protein
MAAEVLGKISFLETPDVSGVDVLLNAGGVPELLADITANRPVAGVSGRLFVDTTTNLLYRDTGSAWVLIGSTPYTGTTNQVNVTGSVISLADDAILPGLQGIILPTGTTGARGTNVAGKIRQNSTLGYAEIGSGAEWRPLGRVLQMVSGDIAAQTFSNTQTPFDATPPTSTEGAQIWTQSFTPISASSRIVISFTLTHVHGTATRTQITALFAGTTNIGSAPTTCAVAASPYNSAMQVVHVPGSTAAITFSCRVGSNGNGTWYINSGATNTLGGTMASEYTITEIL